MKLSHACALCQGRDEEAMDVLQRALTAAPNTPETLSNLASLHLVGHAFHACLVLA